MASQSGSFITQMFDYLDGFGLGFSTAISVGNEADIDIVDCLRHLGKCAHTRVIALYIESIRRGREFIRAARAIAPRKPIVAYYVGGSAGGRKAGLSHTGALAGPDRLYSGIFRQSGILRARSMAELFDFCWVLGACRPPAGNRVIIQTHSGGPGAVAADTCSRAGLVLAEISERTRERLADFIPHTGSIANPVDLTFAKNQMDFFEMIPGILLEDETADGLLVYFLGSSAVLARGLEGMGVPAELVDAKAGELMAAQADAVGETAGRRDRPLIGFTFCRPENTLIHRLQANGIPVLPGPERAARAFAALNEYRLLREKILASGDSP
jgi:acyl-CoA synthetase (NDP forming)